MLATTVSSKILQAFARIEGFHFEVRRSGISEHTSVWKSDDDGYSVFNRKLCQALNGSGIESTSCPKQEAESSSPSRSPSVTKFAVTFGVETEQLALFPGNPLLSDLNLKYLITQQRGVDFITVQG